MNRRPLSTLLAAILVIAVAGPASASLCDFNGIAIFATNSIAIDDGADVTGNVVANNDSPGPFLESGVELDVDKNATIAGNATAFSVDISNKATISGTLTCQTGDSACTGLTPPVFAAVDIPAFKQSDVRPDAEDVFVAGGATVVIGAGSLVCSVALTSCTTDADCPAGEACVAGRTTSFGDIAVAGGGTLVFAGGGRFDVRSISGGVGASVRFQAPTEVRVEGRLGFDKQSAFGPSAGSGLDAADIAVYVGGQNGTTGGLFELPQAVKFGREATVNASVYAPFGTFQLDRDSTVGGAILAADVKIDKNSSVGGVSAFDNKPPTADDKDAFTNDQASIFIALTGSDPEGQALTFAKASDPDFGSASVAGATATYTPTSQLANAEDDFTYTATDECGAVSAPATVRINPPGGEPCDDDNDCDAGFFCNTAGFCEPNALAEVVANDKALESIEDTAITIVLTAAAPCEGSCDGVGNDVPLTFSLPSLTTSQGGSLSGLAQGAGVPRRSASVLYTPPAGFTGADSFDFDVAGDVDDSGGIDPSAEPNPEIDTGTVDITVQTFTPPPPVEARDQRVSTPMDTPVIISLSGNGACAPGDPDCRPVAPLTSSLAEGPGAAARNLPSRGSALDDTGSAAAGEKLARAYWQRPSARAGAATRAAAPGEDLFALDSDLDELFQIDPADGGATSVGSTAAGPTTPASLAFDGTKMYTIDLGGGGLYTLNVADGTPTFVCTTGISGWQGVASDPTDEGQFYGITQSDELYKIDRTSCATSLVATGVGGLIAALEFDANGTLWGAEFGSPGGTTENAALVKIDKTTGAVTIVTQCATRPCSGTDTFLDGFQGIDFATDGTLYGANTNDDSLYVIDTTTGALTNLGPHGTPVFVKGLAFSEEILLEAGFTILTLPATGTLSYLNPATGTQTTITSANLPLLLGTTEQVTYTPPTGATGDPLASFTFQQSDGLTTDTGLVELVVTGAIVIVDPCVAVGRPPGCGIGGALTGGGESAGSEEVGSYKAARQEPNLRVVVEGKGTIATSRRETAAGSFAGLSCSGKCGARYDVGDEVTLYARPVEDSVFAGWQGDCSGSEPITTVTIGRHVTCIAVFESEE